MANNRYKKIIVSINSEKQQHIVRKIEKAKIEEGISAYLIRLVEQDIKQQKDLSENDSYSRILQIIDIMLDVGIDEREILKSMLSVLSNTEKNDLSSKNSISKKISNIAGVV